MDTHTNIHTLPTMHLLTHIRTRIRLQMGFILLLLGPHRMPHRLLHLAVSRSLYSLMPLQLTIYRATKI